MTGVKNNILDIPVVAAVVHYSVADLLTKIKPMSVIDMGGTGRINNFLDCTVVNANSDIHANSVAINCLKLPYRNDNFDAAISIDTLEHVEDHHVFLLESYRVSRRMIVHVFPFGEPAFQLDKFKEKYGVAHPCRMPSEKTIGTFLNEINSTSNFFPIMSIYEHLLMLMPLYKRINTIESYDYAFLHKDEAYLYALHCILGEKIERNKNTN
jgi:hypothetical protein